MSTSYINKTQDFIDNCLDTAFNKELIRGVKSIKKPGDYDVMFSIKGGEMNILNVGDKVREDIMNHRVKSTLRLFSWASAHLDSQINCNFILSPEDDITTGDDSNVQFSKIGYSACINSPHLPIPDPHFTAHTTNPFIDTIPFLQKKPISIFRGTDTSKQRVRLSQKSRSHPLIDSAITNFLPRSNEESFFKGIDKNKIIAPFMDYSHQLEYKYIIEMYGHAISWDRMCWALPSNSILISVLPNPNESISSSLWYSQFIKANNIVPFVSEEDLLDCSNFSVFDKYYERQKQWGSLVFSQETLLSFTKEFLRRYDSIYNG